MMRINKNFLAALLISGTVTLATTACSATDSEQATAPISMAQVTLRSNIEWGPLNPARGDQSPRAGTLWGDRTKAGPSGFLVEFKQGFSSPPHIHNVTYRGLVLSGQVHNDDPGAEAMWLPAGSYWTQPAGEAHITAAEGEYNLAYIEIDKGPYLVRPADQAFDNGERPVNVAPSNLFWLNASDIIWTNPNGDANANGSAKIAFLWGSTESKQLRGSLIKLPAGYSGTLRNNGSMLRAVVIKGKASLTEAGGDNPQTLETGSYFGADSKAAHRLSCEIDCTIYLRTNNNFTLAPSKK